MRLIILSNRLPITVSKKEGRLVVKESTGGLVSGLSSYLDSLKGSSFQTQADYIWLGWPGLEIDEKEQAEFRSKALKDYKAFPVFLSEVTMEKFYQGFCNNTIWPLFHYFPSLTVYEEEFWNYYQHVNNKFLEAVLEVLQPDDVIWIHDYHLMLLPKLIREKRPEIKIGFFLHIPFPSYEIFRLLPGEWRSTILEGLLGANLVGFHTYSDTQYFLRSVLRILGHEADMGKLVIENRIVKADTFPMGINYQKFSKASEDAEVQKKLGELKKNFSNKKMLLSIDRLDYTKGIINRLQAYEIFLDKNPVWHGKIVLLLIVVPSRIGVKQYRRMKSQIDELVGSINGKYGSIDWYPISYQYGFLSFKPLVAFYRFSDIILVTPLRDGMNLISKEYLACRVDKTGALILSEMAGASNELGEALIINPNNRDEIASAILMALEMPEIEQIRRNGIMQTRLQRNDVVNWANDFIQKIDSTVKEQDILVSKLLNENRINELLLDFRNAKRRLIFVDYDGTLVPFASTPEMANPDENLLSLLKAVDSIKKSSLVLISGRDKNILQTWFSSLNLNIIAEHGVWLKEKNIEWKMLKTMLNNWKPQIYSILEVYVDRLPGSFIEEKEFSLAWHYRKSDPELASVRSRELLDHLMNYTSNIDLHILQGNKVIEIRNAGINKGVAGLNWISRDKYDFIMAIGDDWTDEDLFKVLPETAYSIKVGLSNSFSKYYLPHHSNVLDLLNKLVNRGIS